MGSVAALLEGAGVALMANKSKAKGTLAEVGVRDFLRANGFPYAERLPTEGGKDRGDITGVPGVVIEVKNCKTFDLAGWVKECEVEMANAGVELGIVWAKRRGTTDPGKWFVVTTGDVLVKMLAD